MRKISLIFAVVHFLSANADVSTNAVIQTVRAAMDAYIAEEVPAECRDAWFVRNMGISNWDSQFYTNLASVVSNSIDIVIGNLDACATNKFEKYVVMGTGWAFDDDYYLLVLDRLLDQVADGRLELDDVRWYNAGHHSDVKLNTLARNFNLPLVSNIIDKIEAVGGDTNFCNRVRSGEAKRVYDEFETEIHVLRAP